MSDIPNNNTDSGQNYKQFSAYLKEKRERGEPVSEEEKRINKRLLDRERSAYTMEALRRASEAKFGTNGHKNGYQPHYKRKEPSSSNGPISFTTAAQIAEETPADVDWLVRPWIPNGALTLLQGKVGVGKTTFLQAMINAMLAGESFMGDHTRKTKVIYLTEQPAGSFRQALGRAGLLDRDDLIVLYWHSVAGMDWPYIVQQAEAEAERQGAGMLVIDTLARFAGLRGDDENNAGAALEALAPVKEVVGNGRGVVLVHHERISGGDVVDAGRGSSGIAGDVDQILAIRRSSLNRDNAREIIDGKGRYEETPPKTLVELVDGEYRILGDDAVKDERHAPVLNVLPTAPEQGITVDDIYAELDGHITKDTIRRYADSLVASNAAIVTGKRPKLYSKPRVDAANNDGGLNFDVS